jgi:hypothetical protein
MIATVSDRDLPAFDCYRVLGVATTATTTDIEAAFRIAAKRDHPDLHEDAPRSTLRMQQLNVARQWLTDPERRARYDEARGLRPPGGRSIDLPDIDPLGSWSGTSDEERSGSMTGPILASLASMVLLMMIFLGLGSWLTLGIALVAGIVLLYGLVLTILGAVG